MERSNRDKFIQQGFCEGIARKDLCSLVTFALAVFGCTSFLYAPFWLFCILYLASFCLVMIPGIFLMKDDYYKTLSGEDKKNYLKGFAHVIMNANLKVFVSISFTFIFYLLFFKNVIPI